jgi:hypothetical protein
MIRLRCSGVSISLRSPDRRGSRLSQRLAAANAGDPNCIHASVFYLEIDVANLVVSSLEVAM